MKTAIAMLVPAMFLSASALARTAGVPLSTAVQNSLDRYPGLFLANAERDHEKGRDLYEIELAGPDGKKREIHIDVATGERVSEHEEYDDDYVGIAPLQPFTTLMSSLESTGTDDLREIELDEERGRWVYEVRATDANGAVQQLFFDAMTGEMLEGNWD